MSDKKNNPWHGRHGIYLIAEVGGNHEGDFEYAKRLTHLACESGVDSVKFQIYTGDTLVSPVESPDRNKHFKKFELSLEQYQELAEICRTHGVTFSASIWSLEAISLMAPWMGFYKIGSGDLTAYPVIRRIVEMKKPIVLSTGLSTLEEVGQTVDFIQGLDERYKKPENLAILQCTSMYPIPPEDAHLKVMDLFRESFGLPVGYSDHTVGLEAMEVAVAMGAQVLEKHFTDTREGKTFRDHQVSFVKTEVASLIEKIKRIQALHGEKNKIPAEIEIKNNHPHSFRRAVYAKCDLPAGTLVTENQLTVLRPNAGIDARDYFKLLGKRVKHGVKAFHKLDWHDFEDGE